MRLAIFAVFVLAFTGCATAQGDWTGTCTVQASGHSMIASVDLQIDADKNGTLSGTGTLSGSGDSYTGPLSGVRSGTSVDATILANVSGSSLTITFSTTVDKNAMTGDCSIAGSGYTYTGQAQLTR